MRTKKLQLCILNNFDIYFSQYGAIFATLMYDQPCTWSNLHDLDHIQQVWQLFVGDHHDQTCIIQIMFNKIGCKEPR